jgi:hypothetical protein
MHRHTTRWPMFNRVLQQAQRMDAMMERLGVNPALAAREDRGRAYARARAVCLRCPSAPLCERWLALPSGAPEPPPPCPLAAFFASCRRPGPGPAPEGGSCEAGRGPPYPSERKPIACFALPALHYPLSE